MMSGQNLNFAIPVEYVQDLLRHMKAPQPISEVRQRAVTTMPVPPRKPYVHSGVLRRSYDKFEDLTAVTVSNVSTANASIRFAAQFEFPSILVQTAAVSHIKLTAVIQSGGCPRSVGSANAIFLIQDKRLRVPGTVTESSVASAGLCSYRVDYQLDLNDFLALVAAETVEARIGNIDTSFNADGLAALRDFASRLIPSGEPDRVYTGMTRADVRWVMGDPLSYEGKRAPDGWVETWTYPDKIILITNGLVTSIRQRP